ncbi:MAG: 6-bladed beta-propeller [Gemmatimonadaceae bacterium]
MRLASSTYLARALVLAAFAPVWVAAQQVKDSAGARIVRYGERDRARATWSVDPKPLLRIGGAAGEGPMELAQVLGVARLSDGRVVIANGGSTELRVFSPTGAFIRSIGRKGLGPGEFDGIILMYRSADTLVVHDRQGRLQIYTADGTLVRSYARPTFGARGVSSTLGMLSDGASVVQGMDPVTDATSDDVTATATLGLKPPGTNEARAFTQIPVFERVRRGGQLMGLFLGAVSRVAVMGERMCAGYTIRWEVQCFDRGGRLMSRTSRDVRPGRVSDADIEEFRRGYLVANRSQPEEKVKAALQMFQFADRRSAFGRFVPSPTGELWVGEFVVLESFVPGRRGTVIPEKPTTWSVLGADGSWVADVVLPARFSLLDAGRDYVAGIELDEDDVESVVLYRLRR